MKVTVWNEYVHELEDAQIGEVYPKGIHGAIADFLKADDIEVRTATLQEENCGITEELLDDTDVLLWWGHCRHDAVPDEVAKRVQQAVLRGMGIIFLHSAHNSKPFKLLCGTPCSLIWREDNDSELLWVVNPAHPIAQGIDRFVKIPREEMYGEPFAIPEPDQLVFIGWFDGGEVFRSGCCWNRGAGKVFYFQPGHETYPVYHQPEIQTIIKNAVRWAYNPVRLPAYTCPNAKKRAIDE